MAKQTLTTNISGKFPYNRTDAWDAWISPINTNFTGIYDYRSVNVLAPPTGTACVGDSNYTTATGTDDAAAFQAILNAAAASGGVPEILVPGRRTYRIGSTITIPAGVTIRGIGGLSGSATGGGPLFVWSGAADGVMFDVAVAAANITSTIFENINIMGRSDRTNLPATLLRYRGTGGNTGSIDTGSILRNVWFGDCSGNALSIEGGATNFLIENGRWDNWGGYCIYVTGVAGVPKSANISIIGNTTMTNPYACNGGIYLNGEDDGANSLKTVIKVHGLHPEFGSVSLNQTYAGGTNWFDRRGWFRIGVNANVTDVQHHILVEGMQFDGPFSVASSCVFQITATTTADSDLDNTRMINLTVINSKGMSRGTTDGDGSTSPGQNDELRLVGGRIATVHRPPQVMANVGIYQLAIGKYSTGGGIDSQINSHNFRLRTPIIETLTVATLPTSALNWVKAGMKAFVSDSNATLASGHGNTVAGGGANFVPVYYDGSDWRIG